VIGPNSATGILLTGGSANIQANSIWGNAALGIDLAPAGVTPNDPGDADTGPNGLQNFPVITAATSSHVAHLAVVSGTISSAPNTTFRIEVFVSPAAHASGYGEGQAMLSATTVTTNAGGSASFAVGGVGPVANGSVATATATDPAGNTSEFSAALPFVQTQ
jgi:hypothetical protein